MPMHRRRTFTRSSGSARRKLVWATSSVAGSSLAQASITDFDLLANLRVAGSSVLGATVMRTHLRMQIGWPVTTSTGQFFTVGLCVEDADLVAANDITLGERGRDWALLDGLVPGSGANTLASPNTGTVMEGFNFDLRAKRKVQELNQTWQLAVSPSGGAAAVPFSYWARTLIALP